MSDFLSIQESGSFYFSISIRADCIPPPRSTYCCNRVKYSYFYYVLILNKRPWTLHVEFAPVKR